MANPVNRTELLARVFAARAEIGNLFTSLDPAQFVAPGIQGQWSAKDIAAHVTWWDAWLVGLLRQAAAGQELSAGEWMDLDARNELIYQAHRDEPAEQVLAEFARVGEELRQAIEPLSEEALYAMGRYSGPGERGLARLISDNTFDHYGSHRRPILAWLAEASPDPLPYYATQGPVTYPRGLFWMLDDLPSDIPALVATLQGLLLHPYWAGAYGVTLTEARSQEPGLRLVYRQLARLRELDERPLTEPRDLEHRLVGNCRDHATLLAAMLRHQGVPARARCGFGAYFGPGHYEDHWCTEIWDAGRRRWFLVDPQLDALQRERLQIAFDPLDVPRDQFIVAGQAWGMCRRGEADPDAFGIFEMHGLEFVRGNLVRDLLALNKVEILPWDWGFGPLGDEPPESLSEADRWAALTTAGDEAFVELRELFRHEAGGWVPQEWLRP